MKLTDKLICAICGKRPVDWTTAQGTDYVLRCVEHLLMEPPFPAEVLEWPQSE